MCKCLIVGTLLVLSGVVWADPLANVCEGLPQGKITNGDIFVAADKGCFPRVGDELMRIQNRCSFRRVSEIEGLIDTRYEIRERANPDSPLSVAADLTQRLKDLSEKEASKFREAYKRDEFCAIELRDQKPLTSGCMEFREKLIPKINARLKAMRGLLATSLVAQGKFKPEAPMNHSFFPNGAMELKPLTSSELTDLKKAVDSGLRAEAHDRYLDLLSAYPILLHFKGPEVTPEELVRAFKMPSNFEKDFKDLDYVLMDARLHTILSQIPSEKRADYCLVATKLRETAQARQDMMSFGATVFGFVTGTTLIKGVLAAVGFGFADSALESSKAADRMDINLKLCLATNLKNESCSFHTIQEDFNGVKDSSIYLPLFGPPESLSKAKKIQ